MNGKTINHGSKGESGAVRRWQCDFLVALEDK